MIFVMKVLWPLSEQSHYLDFTADKMNVPIYGFYFDLKFSEHMFLSFYPHQSQSFWANWYVEIDNHVHACEQDNNSDNGEKEEDTNLSKVVHCQRIDEGESAMYTSWWLKISISKYRHLKFDNQQPREFQRRKHFKLFPIGRSEKIESFARF